MELDILFEDEHLIAVHKPPGLLVHRTRISEDTIFALQLLRRQVGHRVYPAHRLDRATSGVLLFGKDADSAARLGELFRLRQVQKSYEAVIRGHVPESGQIEAPLPNAGSGDPQESLTAWQLIRQAEHPWAVSRYDTSRYALVRVLPHTGRQHQIRKHFAHFRHPVIGDRRYGDCKHNNYLRDQHGITRLMLHARRLAFTHPFSQQPLCVEAEPDEQYQQALAALHLD